MRDTLFFGSSRLKKIFGSLSRQYTKKRNTSLFWPFVQKEASAGCDLPKGQLQWAYSSKIRRNFHHRKMMIGALKGQAKVIFTRLTVDGT